MDTRGGTRDNGGPLRVSDALVQALECCPLVRGLTRAEVAEIAAMCTIQGFPAQAEVFEEGERCSGLWVLATGRVRLYHATADGRQQVVRFQAPTSPLDLGAALDSRPHTASATTLEPATLLFLPRSVLVTLGRKYPLTLRNVVDLLCLEVRQRDIATAIAALKDARGRIGCVLLQLARQFGVPRQGGVVINYRLTRQDIADRAGVTIETSIRVISELQRQGIIRTQNQIIEILDLVSLQAPTSCEECQFDCSVFEEPVFAK
jgi:CRP/FNR family transcriptional regulator, cyclic AMP receptor protein